jgi:hypothetical protein
MVTVSTIRRRLKALSVKDEAFKSVSETKEVITEKQKEQMLQGLNREGGTLGYYKVYEYAQKKFELNPRPGFGVVDLKMKGNFFDGMETNVFPNTFSTQSTDEKNLRLIKKYDPFGLNDESKKEYLQTLRPVFLKSVREKLKL